MPFVGLISPTGTRVRANWTGKARSLSLLMTTAASIWPVRTSMRRCDAVHAALFFSPGDRCHEPCARYTPTCCVLNHDRPVWFYQDWLALASLCGQRCRGNLKCCWVGIREYVQPVSGHAARLSGLVRGAPTGQVRSHPHDSSGRALTLDGHPVPDGSRLAKSRMV